MARIRTIKPEFFRHFELYQAEQETKLPLRVAFAGLWTAADKEGRFKWLPEALKLDCLPYDNLDFSRVLDALATRGFLVRYASGSLGCIPSWKSHQFLNNREAESRFPQPNQEEIDACLTRGSRVPHATEVEGKGREGEGKGRDKQAAKAASKPEGVPPETQDPKTSAYFAAWIDLWADLRPGVAWVREVRAAGYLKTICSQVGLEDFKHRARNYLTDPHKTTGHTLWDFLQTINKWTEARNPLDVRTFKEMRADVVAQTKDEAKEDYYLRKLGVKP